MKKLLLLALALISINIVFAQKPKPFILQGQLKNFKSTQVFLTLTDINKPTVVDTINVSADGNFYLKTYKVTKPQLALFSRNDAKFNTDLFVSPGYTLTFSAECNDYNTVHTTKKVTGYGAIPNQFLFKRDSIVYRSKNTLNWFELNTPDFLSFEKTRMQMLDSLSKLIFTKKNLSDLATSFFYKMTQLDKKYEQLDRFTSHTLNNPEFTYQRSVDFVTNNCGKNAFANLYDPANLTALSYFIFMRDGYYVYLRKMNCKKADTVCGNQTYYPDCVKLIADNYKGAIKQLTLYNFIYNGLAFSRSFEGINLLRLTFPPYIATLDKAQQQKLNTLMVSKYDELLKTQINKPAPAFTAVDTLGKHYSFENFKGKVILFDLWASWCGPCRQMTPYLEKLVEKYKNDNRLVFVSIAVNDQYKRWLNAMAEDKPTWLQLYDNEGKVAQNYSANSIPKLVVINKQGNITTFDAPISKTFAELEKILLDEMNK
jgi:thiol-disulfide isomerase/thioredoxin